MVDLSRAPLVALSSGTKQLISTLLNPMTHIPTKNGLPRDWKGLAQVCKIGGETMRNVFSDPDPTGRILVITGEKCKDFTLQNLKEALETIERWDVVDDTQEMLEKDAELYLERLQRSQESAEQINADIDSKILTIDDLFRLEAGHDSQRYDAFVLYAEEDEVFTNELVEKLENENNMKLCLKERDLIAGVSFEHEAIMKLISERCNRLILVISPDFFKSPANKFFTNFAQAASIDKDQERKIIPCIYKNCELPRSLSYFTKIYYNKISPEHFWKKLVCSTKVAANNKIHGAIKNNSAQPIKTKNSLLKLITKEKPKANFNCSELEESALQPFSVKKEDSSNPDLKADEKSSKSESLPHLPSLENLDTLSVEGVAYSQKKPKKKKKSIKNYMKELLTKS